MTPFSLRLSLLFAAAVPALVPAHAQEAMGKTVPGRFLVTYRDGTIPPDAAQSAAVAGARLLLRHERMGVSILQAPAALAEQTRRALAAQPGVALVVEDRVMQAHAIKAAVAAQDADTLYHSQQGWAVRQAGGYGADATDPSRPGPWNITRGRGVRIAILDSGVDAAHPDIAPNLALNLSEVDQTAMPSACDDGTPQDQQGHGTWTASLAAGALGAGTGRAAGVAPEATLLNIKVLERVPGAPTSYDPSGCATGQASGLLSWVIQGIEDAVQNHADVISLSLGTVVDLTTGDGAGLKATFDHATHAAFAAGTIVVAAAGNDGFDLSSERYVELPAQARDVVAVVAATNPGCSENLLAGATCAPGPVTMPYYSNFGGPLNALAAPGGSYPAGPTADPTQPTGWIVGACSQGRPGTQSGPPSDPAHSLGCFGLGHTPYVQAMGTSASAPLTAGVVALILAAHPTWNATSAVAWLRQTATAVAGMSVPQVNAAGAIPPASLHASPIVGAGNVF